METVNTPKISELFSLIGHKKTCSGTSVLQVPHRTGKRIEILLGQGNSALQGLVLPSSVPGVIAYLLDQLDTSSLLNK